MILFKRGTQGCTSSSSTHLNQVLLRSRIDSFQGNKRNRSTVIDLQRLIVQTDGCFHTTLPSFSSFAGINCWHFMFLQTTDMFKFVHILCSVSTFYQMFHVVFTSRVFELTLQQGGGRDGGWEGSQVRRLNISRRQIAGYFLQEIQGHFLVELVAKNSTSFSCVCLNSC